MTPNSRRLLLRWIVANGVSEMLGLGLTFAVIGASLSGMEDQSGTISILLSFLIAVVSGGIEATLVGLAQWWAMRPQFPEIPRFGWWRATLIGALIAYVLGYLPSTIMSLGEGAAQTPPAEPPQWLVLLLAVGMGAVGGAVLSFAQWRVLRRTIRGAGLWIPANMLAWAAGMPIIFAGMDAAFAQEVPFLSAVLMAASFLLAGTVVGGIHGAFLVRLAEKKRAFRENPA